MIRNEVRMTVYSYEMAKEVSELAEAMGCKVYVHIKLDTGMARLGFQITRRMPKKSQRSVNCRTW